MLHRQFMFRLAAIFLCAVCRSMVAFSLPIRLLSLFLRPLLAFSFLLFSVSASADAKLDAVKVISSFFCCSVIKKKE